MLDRSYELAGVGPKAGAEQFDINSPEHAGFRQMILSIYTPRYGEQWAEMLDAGAAYARIAADRVYTFHGEGL